MLKKYDYTIRNIIQYVLGLLTLTLGLVFIISSKLGPTPWDFANINIANTFGISIGTAMFASGIVIVLFCAILNKEIPNAYVIFSSFLSGKFLDMWLYLFSDYFNIFDAFILKLILALLGLVIGSIGLVIYVRSKLFPNFIDYLMVTLRQTFKLKNSIAKIITDLSGVTIGLLLGGALGFFTVVVMLTFGLLFGFFDKVYVKILKDKV